MAKAFPKDNLTVGNFYTTGNEDTYATTNEKDFNKFGYFLNGIDVTQQNLDKFDPYIQGVSRIFMLKSPKFMDSKFPGLTKQFKSILETGYTRVDGINDITVDFVDFEGGFAGQKFSNVSLSRDDTDTISISVYEQSGSPVRLFLDTWVTGVRDPRNGVATYHQASFTASGAIQYNEMNHNAEMLYMTLDPTAKRLEYACLLAKMFPTKVPKSHLNFEKGNRSETLLDLEFRCVKYESPYINDLAAQFLAKDQIKYSYLNFNPGYAQSDIDNSYQLSLNNDIKDVQDRG